MLTLLKKWLFFAPPIKLMVADATLGEIRFFEDGEWWTVTVQVDGRRVVFNIGGQEEPSPALIRRAHYIVHEFEFFERSLQTFLAQEAALQVQQSSEIHQLRLEAINLLWPNRPNYVELTLLGPDRERLWGCACIEGRFINLAFDGFDY